MKYRKLIRELSVHGFRLLRQGSQHELWTNDDITIAVPRHREIVESTARRILRKAALCRTPQI
ncbi:MAG: type II toxin-antitoxin system HicA family toxin [bacterium]